MKPLRSPADLAAAGLVPPDALAGLERVAARYAVAVTPAMAELMDPADPADPIARQFLPQAFELEASPVERADPIGDTPHSPVEGVIHRYPDRLLLKLTHTCATYCRFCFRRETVGQASGALSGEALEAAYGYIAAHPQVWEVILTGGDPMILSPRRLGEAIARLSAIDHVKVIRLHTRVPAVHPDAIDADLVAALASDKAMFVVLHANHARELTPSARAACRRIIDAGVPMLSQSVLLKGVNDDPAALEALLRALVETRIKPYYLHQGDLAPGTAPFRTTIGEGQALVKGLRGAVSGLCQPTYVLDIPGGYGKAPLTPCHLHEDEDGLRIEDPSGVLHGYPPAQPA